MIEKKYLCVSCGQIFSLELLEQGEPLPPNTRPTAPRCECGSTALIDPKDANK